MTSHDSRPATLGGEALTRPNTSSSQPPGFQRIPTLLPDGRDNGSGANISAFATNHATARRNRSAQSRRQQHAHWRNTNIQLDSAALRDFSSIIITLDRLPQDITAGEIWSSLTSHDLSITRIELLENANGERIGRARVSIEPPPSRWPPWDGPHNFCVIDTKNSSSLRIPVVSTVPTRASSVKTPANRYIPRQVGFTPDGLLLGMLAQESVMLNFPQYKYHDVEVKVKFFRKEFEITFAANLDYYGITDFMMRFDFSHVKKILRVTHEDGQPALVILLPSPPKFYCLMPICHDDSQSLWQEWDSWARQTDITHMPHKLKHLPAGLEKHLGESVDLGRWTAYHFEMTPESVGLWERIDSFLSDYRIKTEAVTNFRFTAPGPTNAWELLNSSADSLSLETLHSGCSFHLPFEVRYQLEVCISHGLLNEYNIDAGFLQKLTAFEAFKARMMLECVAEKDVVIYDPMKIFEDPEILNYWPNARVPDNATLVRRAVVTPTTVHFKTPCAEQTNRILRKYSDLNDRFLRVQFTDEMAFGKIFSSPQNSKKDDNLYLRVHRVMSNGIVVGDRCYRFLAFGNAQFRENGAFFFCETDHVTCDSIRDWMGDFQHIRSVGKFAARMGQCFTTTRQVSGISLPQIHPIADIERQKDNRVWNFTDGIGKMSSFLARMIANERGLPEIPSCYQMRMGGCKGVLVVWPGVPPKEVHIRPSQEKFKAIYNGLEIIKTSSYSHATLNKQIIPILSALGVSDDIFEEMLKEELQEYEDGLADSLKAGELLRSRVDESQVTLIMAEMVDTFMDTNEPFLQTLLNLWKIWVFKRLKYKAAIGVKESAMVYGVVDEVGVLRGHSKKTEGKGYNRTETLPQIFLQVPIVAWDGRLTTDYKVITGLCVVGRNPSLHAGDVRVVEAVDVPELRHLKNVVVFPQTGDRDIPSMCSGGDLDGDDYFVFWDKRLLPTEWDHPPMDHDASSGVPEPEGPADVSVEDVIRFFAQYMKNDSLGAIATAHFAQADQGGVKHPKCIELAKLHSKAVDYIKSGNPAVMEKHLRPKKWPHWMEKKPDYISTSAIGKIYDHMRIKKVEWHPVYDKPFDTRILSRYQLDDKILAKAREVKSAYDIAMRRLMGQHEAPVTEFEIWSTFILSKPRVGSDYKLQENVGREMSALKERFRLVCAEAVAGVELKESYASAYSMIELEKLDQFAAAMYTVTYDEVQAALRERATPQLDDEGEVVEIQMPLISFPWLFHRELARVALGREGNVRPLRKPTYDEQGRQKHHHDGEHIGEDYVRTSGGNIFHRGEVLDLFTENREAVVGSQSTTGTTANVSSVNIKDSNDTAGHTQVENTPGRLSPVEYGYDEEQEFPEVEFEEVDDISSQEDALETLAKKIAM